VNAATPIEYSIFLFLGSERALEACLAEVANLMEMRTDDVRQRGLQERLGKATLPEGIQWTGLPTGLRLMPGSDG